MKQGRTRERRVAQIAATIGFALGFFFSSSKALAQSLQTGGAESNFGNARLAGGFAPTPHTVTITSGGSIDASNTEMLPDECRGFVSRRPDYILHYQNAAAFLRMYVEGNGDTTLVVNAGNGRWYCNDDVAFGNINPMLEWESPSSGQYDIWIGSFRSGRQVRGTLTITENERTRPSGDPAERNPHALQTGGNESNFGSADLRGGFAPDPFEVEVRAGGNVDTRQSNLGRGCHGYTTRPPDYIIRYESPNALLRFTVRGRGDTTLLVHDGANRWHCDDDSAGEHNPEIVLQEPTAGQYDVWIGSFGANDLIEGTLVITESAAAIPARPSRASRNATRRPTRATRH